MPVKKSLYVWLVFFLALTSMANQRLDALYEWRYPALTELSYSDQYAADLGALMLGAHRVAADVAHIQYLQYYGTRENADPGHSTPLADEHDHHDDEKGHPDHHAKYAAQAVEPNHYFPHLFKFALRTLRLDPFFHSANLEYAGALAFNERRSDESLTLLQEAIQRDPTFYRYHLYASAILYREEGNDMALIDRLLEAIRYPDCPPLLENVLGNLLVKNHRLSEAAAVYLHTYETAPRASDRETAQNQLVDLLQENPDLAQSMGIQVPGASVPGIPLAH